MHLRERGTPTPALSEISTPLMCSFVGAADYPVAAHGAASLSQKLSRAREPHRDFGEVDVLYVWMCKPPLPTPPLAVRFALAFLAGVGSGRPIGRDSAAWSGKANGWAARALELPRPLPFQTSHSRHPRFPLRMARQGEKQKLRIGQGGEMLAGFLQEGPISASALPRALLL